MYHYLLYRLSMQQKASQFSSQIMFYFCNMTAYVFVHRRRHLDVSYLLRLLKFFLTWLLTMLPLIDCPNDYKLSSRLTFVGTLK